MPVEGFILEERHFDPRIKFPVPLSDGEREFATRVVYIYGPGRTRIAKVGDFIFQRPDGLWDVVPAEQVKDKIITT